MFVTWLERRPLGAITHHLPSDVVLARRSTIFQPSKLSTASPAMRGLSELQWIDPQEISRSNVLSVDMWVVETQMGSSHLLMNSDILTRSDQNILCTFLSDIWISSMPNTIFVNGFYNLMIISIYMYPLKLLRTICCLLTDRVAKGYKLYFKSAWNFLELIDPALISSLNCL